MEKKNDFFKNIFLLHMKNVCVSMFFLTIYYQRGLVFHIIDVTVLLCVEYRRYIYFFIVILLRFYLKVDCYCYCYNFNFFDRI